MTVSQSGQSKYLIRALETAKRHDITCFNVVNVEDSPITKADPFGSPVGKYEEASQMQSTRHIGFYMKSGYCYCDIKSFVPIVVSMALVAIWFSDHKTKKPISKELLLIFNRYYRGDQEDEAGHD